MQEALTEFKRHQNKVTIQDETDLQMLVDDLGFGQPWVVVAQGRGVWKEIGHHYVQVSRAKVHKHKFHVNVFNSEEAQGYLDHWVPLNDQEAASDAQKVAVFAVQRSQRQFVVEALSQHEIAWQAGLLAYTQQQKEFEAATFEEARALFHVGPGGVSAFSRGRRP